MDNAPEAGPRWLLLIAQLPTEDPAAHRIFAQEIIDKGLSVREAERAAKRGKSSSQDTEKKDMRRMAKIK